MHFVLAQIAETPANLPAEAASSMIQQTIAGGYLVATSLVCCLQYLWHLRQVKRVNADRARHREEMQEISRELTSVQHERALGRVEGHLLREFITQSDPDHFIDLLLRTLLPDRSRDFALLISTNGCSQSVYRGRGLPAEIQSRFLLKETTLRELATKPWSTISLDGPQADTALFLPKTEHQYSAELVLFPLRDEKEVFAVVATTRLFPQQAPREQQLEITRKLLETVGNCLQRSQSFNESNGQLQATREKLALRSIADAHTETPLNLVKMFLTEMLRMTGSETAAMFVKANRLHSEWNTDSAEAMSTSRESTPSTKATNIGWTAVVREDSLGERDQTTPADSFTLEADAADSSQQTLDSTRLHRSFWNDKEQQLIAMLESADEMTVLDGTGFADTGTTVGSAVGIPLRHGSELLGWIVFTRRSRSAPPAESLEMATWAANHLALKLMQLRDRAEMTRKAQQDALTGLANRRTFDCELQRVLTKSADANQEFSLLLCDLDRFKQINDNHGHQAGDEVLRVTAAVLQEQALQTRSSDRVVIARYGGEELAILLPGIGQAGALRIGESIRAAIADEPVLFQKRAIRVTASLGVATWPRNGDTPEQLIAAADTALYEAKSQGRDRVIPAQNTTIAN